MSIIEKIENARQCLQLLNAREAKAIDAEQQLQARNSRLEMQKHLSDLHRARRDANSK